MNEEIINGKSRGNVLRKAGIWMAIILGVLLLGLGARMIYLKLRYPESDIIKGIPQSALLVIEGKNFLNFIATLSGSSLWELGFNGEDSTDHLSLVSVELSKLVKKGDQGFTPLMTEQPFSMSLIPRKQDGPAFLFLIQLKHGTSPTSIQSFLKKHWTSYSEKVLLEIRYYERLMPDSTILYIAIRDGIMMASLDREVFELAYYTVESGNAVAKEEAFREVRATLSKSQNPAIRVYVSYEGLYNWFSRFIKPECKPLIASLPDMGSWAALEMMMDDEGAHLQGFSGSLQTGKGISDYLSPTTQPLSDPGEVLPAGTLFYDQIGFDSFGEYYHSFILGYRHLREASRIVYPVSQSLQDSVISTLDLCDIHSVTLAITDQEDSVPGSNFLLIIHSENPDDLGSTLLAFSDTLASFLYQDIKVLSFKKPYLLPALFGVRFHAFEEACYAFLGNHVVFAPSQRALLSVLNMRSLNQTLASLDTYKAMTASMQGRTSKRHYCNMKNGMNFLRNLVDQSKTEHFDKLFPYLPGEFMFSFTKDKDVMLTDLLLHAGQRAQGPKTGGEVILDGAIAGEPVIIKDHRTRDTKLIVADRAGYLYLVNSRGELEWKVNTKEPPLSALHVIDVYRNGRQQCLFMSRNHLHLIQIDGNYVPGFPVRMATPFHSHLSVFDYEQNGNFRFIYRDVNARLSNVDINGRMVSGWTSPAVNLLQRPSIHFRNAGMDYLILTDTSGALHFLDRRGNKRFSLPATIQISERSDMVLTRSLECVHFTFIDRRGNLYQISADGKALMNEALHLSSDAYLLQPSPGQAKLQEIVVVEPGVISVFDTDLKLLRRSEPAEEVFSIIDRYNTDPQVLFAGLDSGSQPVVIFRAGFRKVGPLTGSYDFVKTWRNRPEGPGIMATGKGALLKISGL